jgi:cytidine deaminase
MSEATTSDPVMTARLLEKARAAAASAYSPYSRVQVGCALRTVAGGIYAGCNVENASYGLTICAERVAVGSAVVAEGPGMQWAELAVVALGLEFPPCGACRQVLQEFAVPGAKVTFLSQGQPLTWTMEELLPAQFERSALPGRAD